MDNQAEGKNLLSCPFCRASIDMAAEHCSSCNSIFPWVLTARELRARCDQLWDEMRARETNRLRATTAVLQEAFAQARTGKRISIPTLVGLANAWLMPRAVVIAGSIFATVLLGWQTYILWKQSDLLKAQADAATLDRIERVRGRLATLNIISGALHTMPAFTWYAGSGPGAIRCRSPSCFKVSTFEAFETARARQIAEDTGSASGLPIRNAVDEAAAVIAWTTSSLRRDLESIEAPADVALQTLGQRNQPSNEAMTSFTRLLELAQVHCGSGNELPGEVRLAANYLAAYRTDLRDARAMERASYIIAFPPEMSRQDSYGAGKAKSALHHNGATAMAAVGERTDRQVAILRGFISDTLETCSAAIRRDKAALDGSLRAAQ